MMILVPQYNQHHKAHDGAPVQLNYDDDGVLSPPASPAGNTPLVLPALCARAANACPSSSDKFFLFTVSGVCTADDTFLLFSSS